MRIDISSIFINTVDFAIQTLAFARGVAHVTFYNYPAGT